MANPTRTIIAIPFYRSIEPETVLPIIQTLFSGNKDYQFGMDMYGTTNVAEGRNVLSENFMTNPEKPEVLFFVDSDMVFNPRQVHEVIKQLRTNKEAGLVAGLYCKRSAQMTPLVGWYHEGSTKPLPMDEQINRLLDGAGGVVEADILPTGFMAIKREVFETMEKPWFHLDHKGPDGSTRSSDVVFVEKVREIGFKTYAHLGLDLGHIGKAVFTNSEFYANAHMFRSSNQLSRIKEDALEKHGANTKEYWDVIWEAENDLQAFRDLPKLHDPIVAAIQPHWNVAEVGSGPGVLASKINKKAQSVYCYDISEVAIDLCKKRDLDGRVFDVQEDQLNPDEHGKYDCVVCSELIEHVKSPEKLIKLLHAMLKPCGLLVLTCPNDRFGPEVQPEHERTITPVQLSKYMDAFENRDILEVDPFLIGMGTKKDK